MKKKKKAKTPPKRTQRPKTNPLTAFLSSFARIQMGPAESCTVLGHPAYGEVELSASGARPVLRYWYWPKKMDYHPAMPQIKAVVGANTIQIAQETQPSLDARRKWFDTPAPQGKTPPPEFEQDWNVVSIDDIRLTPIKPLLLSFQHHQWLHHSYKRKKTNG